MPASATPEASLWLRIGIGALVLVLAAWLFGAIAEDVATGDSITALDVEIAQWLHRHSDPALTRVVLWITNLHSTVAVSLYAVVAAVVLYRRRSWRRLLLVFTCVAGGLTVNVLMKLAFHRARPVLDQPLLTLSSYSFPSGHVAGSTIVYGLLVALAFVRTRRPLLRAAAIAGATLAIAIVAFTRMYLGVHFLSDVVAAAAEGVAWLTICLTAFAAFWRGTGAAPGGAPAR